MRDLNGGPPESSTALVLSSGGIRGLAHVGAWKALAEAGVGIDHIIGTSIGALVGGAVATGVPLEELEERARRMRRGDVAVPWRWPWWARGTPYPGLLRGDVIRHFVEDLLPDDPERLLTVPLDIATVNLDSGELVWFTFRPGSGPDGSTGPDGGGPSRLVDAVLASMAIPVFYPPVRIGETSYVDGSVLAPLPLRRAAELGADRILAVDVRNEDEEDMVPSPRKDLLGVSLRTLSIATSSRTSWHATVPEGHDLHRIEPAVEGVGYFDFSSNDRLVAAGYQATLDILARVHASPADADTAGTPAPQRMAG